MRKYGGATKDDLEILKASADDQATFTQRFFDWAPDPWQKQFAAAAQPNVCVLGGAGSGKTLAMLMGALWLCALVPHFKFLNVSYTAWQANIPYRIAASMIEGRPFERLLKGKLKARPYPIIELWNGSTLEFMTVGRDAESLRGGEWDWINYDEGGLQYSEEVFAVLFGRLRGVRTNGKPRLCRFSTTTTPTSAPWLKRMYFKGVVGHETHSAEYASIRVRSWDNRHLTESQLKRMAEAMPSDEMRRVEMDAEWPDTATRIFMEQYYAACESEALNTKLDALAEEGKAILVQDAYGGILKFELPREPGHFYMAFGDGGTGNAPGRGASCVEVWDVSKTPRELAAFNWISGNGKWEPFLSHIEHVWAKYKAAITVDATGPQTIIPELLNRKGIQVQGLSLTTQKDEAITATQMLLQRREVAFPHIKGRREQYLGYELPDTKIAQDIVMAGVMAGFKFYSMEVPSESIADTQERHHRRRSRTGTRRRPQGYYRSGEGNLPWRPGDGPYRSHNGPRDLTIP